MEVGFCTHAPAYGHAVHRPAVGIRVRQVSKSAVAVSAVHAAAEGGRRVLDTKAQGFAEPRRERRRGKGLVE